jgi:Protein of unknown function (DUF433)
VFAGTRVPVAALFDHLKAGYCVEYFLSQFPSVRQEQVSELPGNHWDLTTPPSSSKSTMWTQASATCRASF